MKITRMRKTHRAYREGETNYVGKYQYIYSSGLGEISLIKLVDELYKPNIWEIYCLKGDLFEDIIRFKTKLDAEIFIYEKLYNPNMIKKAYENIMKAIKRWFK